MPVSVLTAAISFMGDCGESASTRRRASEWGTNEIGASAGETSEGRRVASEGAGVVASSSESEDDDSRPSGCGGTGVTGRPVLAAFADPRLTSTARVPPANSSESARSDVEARSTPSFPS